MPLRRGTQDVRRMRVTHEPCQFEADFGLLKMISTRIHDSPNNLISFGSSPSAAPKSESAMMVP
jgi:hypothetical protein